jgi:hypothetical protein
MVAMKLTLKLLEEDKEYLKLIKTKVLNLIMQNQFKIFYLHLELE